MNTPSHPVDCVCVIFGVFKTFLFCWFVYTRVLLGREWISAEAMRW